MVVDQRAANRIESTEAQTDLLFHALADATRRDIVRLVMVDEHSVSSLARRYPVSFAAVQKHVAVLERAGLVAKRKAGREALVAARVEAIRDAAGLLDELEALWRGRLDRFADVLHEQFPTAPATQRQGAPE